MNSIFRASRPEPFGNTQRFLNPGGSAINGNFRYHSHSELQRNDGLYGGLVIHKPLTNGVGEDEKYGYDEEQLLLIGDWYHRTAEQVQASYLTFRSSGHEVIHESVACGLSVANEFESQSQIQFLSMAWENSIALWLFHLAPLTAKT